MSYFEHDDAIRSMIRRAQNLKIDDSGDQQLVDLVGMYRDRPRKVVHYLPHGFSANPPPGSDGVLFAHGGRSDRPGYLDGGHKDHRPRNLPSGGTALYDANGKILKIVKDETTFDAGNKPVRITNASTVLIEGATDVAIGTKDGRYVRMRPGRVDLAILSPTENAPYRVGTEGGYSDVVFARID